MKLTSPALFARAWSAPPESPALGPDEVHVWRVWLEQPEPVRGRLRALLDAGEMSRAERFHFARDRDRFVVARGVLRALLGSYLGVGPEALGFEYNSFGKPSLKHEAAAPPVRFNLSHSHGLALYAFARDRELGVDVERVRAEFASEEVAECFFSAREAGALRGLRPALRTVAFFNCWTRKEAYIKAIGEGLSHPLESFTVSLAPGEPAALLSVEGDPAQTRHWSLRELEPAPGYVAALAVERPGWRLSCYEWPDAATLRAPSSLI